jgi:hypothetical protein
LFLTAAIEDPHTSAGVIPYVTAHGEAYCLFGLQQREGEGVVLSFLGGKRREESSPVVTAAREFYDATGGEHIWPEQVDEGKMQWWLEKCPSIRLHHGKYELFFLDYSTIARTAGVVPAFALPDAYQFSVPAEARGVCPFNSVALHWLPLSHLVSKDEWQPTECTSYYGRNMGAFVLQSAASKEFLYQMERLFRDDLQAECAAAEPIHPKPISREGLAQL